MKKLLVLLLMLITVSAYSQNLVEDTYGIYTDSIAIAGSTDAGTTWFKNRGFDKVYAQIFNGAKWFEIELATDAIKTFDKFKVNMEGDDTTLTFLGNTNDPNATDISIILPVWSTSSTMVYSLDFGNGGAFGTSASPIVVRFKGVYKRNF